jgi:chemotaxis protein MotB
MARKKKTIDDVSGANVGMMMSISLFLILLTFFILLNSIAVRDERRAHKAIGSLLGAFGSFRGGLSPSKTGNSIMPPSPPLSAEKVSVQRFLSVMDQETLLQIKIEKCEEKEIISINGRVLFDDNLSILKESSYKLLNQLCSLIKKGGYSAGIVGHTDNVPAEEKGYKSNWELSTLMATKVLRYLVEKGNAPPERLTAYGCAGYRPINPNDTRQARLTNTRIDIILSCDVPAYVKRIFARKPTGIFSYKGFDFKIF